MVLPTHIDFILDKDFPRSKSGSNFTVGYQNNPHKIWLFLGAPQMGRFSNHKMGRIV